MITTPLSPIPATPKSTEIPTTFEELEAQDVAQHNKEKAARIASKDIVETVEIIEEKEQESENEEEMEQEEEEEIEVEEIDESAKDLPLPSNVVPRIMYSRDVEWHLQERDNTNMNSLKLDENGVDKAGKPIPSVSKFLTNSNDRIGRILTNPNMTLKKVINRQTALVLFNKIAEQFNMRKIEMLKRDCQANILSLVKKLWLSDGGLLSENSIMPASFYNYVHSWDVINIYNSDNKVEKFNATASYFNHNMADILYCIDNKMISLTYITQMCSGAVYYASNSNHTKYIQALNEMNNGLMNGADYYRSSQQWDQQQQQRQQQHQYFQQQAATHRQQWQEQQQLQQQQQSHHQESGYEHPKDKATVMTTILDTSITPQEVSKHDRKHRTPTKS